MQSQNGGAHHFFFHFFFFSRTDELLGSSHFQGSALGSVLEKSVFDHKKPHTEQKKCGANNKTSLRHCSFCIHVSFDTAGTITSQNKTKNSHQRYRHLSVLVKRRPSSPDSISDFGRFLMLECNLLS